MEPMKPSKLLLLLRDHFHCRFGQRVAFGRDLYYEDNWVGYLSYDNMTDQPRGFVIGAAGKHLRAMCILHDQRIIE